MTIDLDIARRANTKVDEPVTSDLFDHVRQKGQGRLDVASPRSVEIECDLDLGLGRLA
jgi:hypothetical protein